MGDAVNNVFTKEGQQCFPYLLRCLVCPLIAAFCATAASTCLSGDGRILAFCDGSCVLTLDTAAAANAEASSPHRGALSSPVGLLRVADCPGVPAPMTDSLPAGSRERTGSRVGEVQNIVRRMLTATHSVPQYRR